MAEFTTIPDASLQPDKPIRSIDGLALRDNAIAIAEGAVGAPRIRTAALQAPAGGGTTYLIRRIQEAAVTQDPPFSGYQVSGLHDKFDHKSHLGCTVLVAGTIRAYLEIIGTSGVADRRTALRVIKNGVLVQEWLSTATVWTAFSVDVSVAVGDSVVFQMYSESQLFNIPSWRYLRIYSTNPDMAVA